MFLGFDWSNAIGGSSQYKPGGSSQNNPGGSSHYRPGGSSQNNPGGSSQYRPGGSSQYRPGGSSQNRGKRSPENTPYWSGSSAHKPNYNDQGFNWNNNNHNNGIDWNQNHDFGHQESCYSDSDCSGRQKCCSRKCTRPVF